MKVLIVNKFLYPNGGSETYIFKLGETLEKKGMKYNILGWSMRAVLLEMKRRVIHQIWISTQAG